MKVYGTANGQGVPQRPQHPSERFQEPGHSTVIVRRRDTLNREHRTSGVADPVVSVEGGTAAPHKAQTLNIGDGFRPVRIHVSVIVNEVSTVARQIRCRASSSCCTRVAARVHPIDAIDSRQRKRPWLRINLRIRDMTKTFRIRARHARFRGLRW
jgi:hypothetical protein